MKVLIATGGTGGHLFPALWVSDEIQKKGHEVLLVGSFPVGQSQISARNLRFIDLKTRGIQWKHLIKFFGSCWLMGVAIFRCFKIFWDEKPKVVIGFGGYGSFPVVLISKCFRVPSMIHEQNIIPGKANAFLGRIVDKVAISFEGAKEFFPKSKVVETGCPCHAINKKRDAAEAYKFFGLSEKKFTFLVFGGSQGSEKINQVFMDVIAPLSQIKDFQVIHVTGNDNFVAIKEKYRELKIPSALYKFLDRMDYAYSIANMVIARAGAVTIAEIINTKVLSVLIPYPFATQDHQTRNAEILGEKGLAVVLDQKDFNENSLEHAILQNFEKIGSVKNMDDLFKNIGYTGASEKVALEALKLCPNNSVEEATV